MSRPALVDIPRATVIEEEEPIVSPMPSVLIRTVYSEVKICFMRQNSSKIEYIAEGNRIVFARYL
jgi:hypothetical protein